MTRRRPSIDLAGFAALALAMALTATMPASAQPAGTFSLPPGETPRPAAGPADPETPSTTPSPVASPAATPTPPRIVLPPQPRAAPSPTPTPAARPSPRPTAAATARPAATPATPAAPAATTAIPPPAALPSAEPNPAPETPALPTEPAATPSAEAAPPWREIAGGIGLVLGIALIVWLLRRGRARRITEAAESWEAAPTPPSPTPPPPPGTATAAPSAPPPAAPPPYAPLPRGEFALGLDPLRMTLAMINATFVYRLTVGNPGAEPLGPLRITCDMISAHASLAAAEQLMPDPSTAWLSHDFDAIPPGESITIDGELRLPRAEIRPIRSGDSAIFAPLARFTLQTLAGRAPALLGARVFVIGEEAEQPGGPVRPFRLNDGTRSYSRISQREVAIS